MRTPKEFEKNLKDGIVTKEMLGMVIYSYNKRAKNYRDKEREYREYRYDKFNNEEKYRDKKDELYRCKEKLLSFVEPFMLHLETIRKNKTVRFYSYEDEYYTIDENKVVKTGDYWDKDLKEMVEFLDIIENEILENYYLYYEIDNFKFHSPIKFSDIEKYKGFNIKDIGCLNTKGIEINGLLSVQFCNKVLNFLVENKAKLE